MSLIDRLGKESKENPVVASNTAAALDFSNKKRITPSMGLERAYKSVLLAGTMAVAGFAQTADAGGFRLSDIVGYAERISKVDDAGDATRIGKDVLRKNERYNDQAEREAKRAQDRSIRDYEREVRSVERSLPRAEERYHKVSDRLAVEELVLAEMKKDKKTDPVRLLKQEQEVEELKREKVRLLKEFFELRKQADELKISSYSPDKSGPDIDIA